MNVEKINEFFSDDNIRCGWLQYLANRRGDFKTAYNFKLPDGSKGFSKHRTVIECQETDNLKHLQQATHRQIFSEEIILDFDIKDFNNSKEEIEKAVYDCYTFLDSNKITYRLFFTGSTGYHLHLAHPEVKQFQSAIRWEKARRFFINKFKCDSLKSSTNVLIALEFAPHWKTGNQKKLIRDTANSGVYYGFA